MRIVFVHREGPGQFRHLASRLAADGAAVTVVCERIAASLPGVRFVRHAAPRPRSPEGNHAAIPVEHVERATRVADALLQLARRDGAADAVVGHIGWGSMLFARDALPDTPMLAYCEYFYHAAGADLGFDPAEPLPSLADRKRLKLRNMVQLATLDSLGAGISPTGWQRSLYPPRYRPQIGVCHEGIDTAFCRPDPAARFRLPDGRTVSAGDPVVTYAARSLEPYRGFPQFMRAAKAVAEKRPDAVFLVAGEPGTSYGPPRTDGRSWPEAMMKETGLDPARIVFLGTLAHTDLVRLFQVSAAHVYLTFPFVLSWSVLEAMACGALVIGSDTAPVREAIRSGRNGLLVDFWDTDALAGAIVGALRDPAAHRPLRLAARRSIEERYALGDCVLRQRAILARLCSPAARPGAAAGRQGRA